MDLYRVLGLTHDADAVTIRTAYRRLAKQYHPDVSTLPDAQARSIAITITEAYEVLNDPAARDKYDRTSLSPVRAPPPLRRRHAMPATRSAPACGTLLGVQYLGLPNWIVFLGLLLLIGGGGYANVEFDEWHNERQKRRKREETR